MADISIAELKWLYKGYEHSATGTITGRVISTDQYGMNYKSLVIEDEGSGYPAGIMIRIDLENYYRKYYLGMKLRVYTGAMMMSSYNGRIQLGIQNGGYIPPDWLGYISILPDQDADHVPEALTIGTIVPSFHISRLVSFSGVQFEQAGLAWCDPEATEGTDRYIVDRSGRRLAVRTSPRAEFAAAPLPDGSGYIEGILGVFNGTYQLEVNSRTDAMMKEERF